MLRMERVSSRNVRQLLRLQVRPEQAGFVATNTMSIIEAYTTTAAGGHAFPFGLFDDEEPVGFLMIGFGTDAEWDNPPAIAHGSYNIWRLMIDARHQGRGYGRQAMLLALDFIRTLPCGSAPCVWLSYEPENHAARELYASFGFRETDGDEMIAALPLIRRELENP